MASDQSSAGKAMLICVMLMFFGMFGGMSFILFGGFIPFFPFGLMPLIMIAFGFVFCFAILRANSNMRRARRRYGSGYSISTTGDAMYSESRRGVPSYRQSSKRVVYQVPPRCPSCSASLNTEQVEWVGPLQAQCPYCLATIEATERDF